MTVTLRFDQKNVEIILCTVMREIELKVKSRHREEICAVDNNQNFAIEEERLCSVYLILVLDTITNFTCFV